MDGGLKEQMDNFFQPIITTFLIFDLLPVMSAHSKIKGENNSQYINTNY